MPQSEFHRNFAAALLDPALPAPPGLTLQAGASAAARFAVYRNNVIVSLIDALAARFPVTLRLVGDDFFRAMTRGFVRARPPRDPVLWRYGGALPAFIETFAPAATLPYLADVARVEIAWSDAWAAAEGAVVEAPALQGVHPEDLLMAGAMLHPATRLLRSAHPAASLWSGHQTDAEPRTPAIWAPEDLLLTPPHADIELRLLPPGGFTCLSALAAGDPFDAAFAAALEESPDTDPAALLVLFLEAGALSSLTSENG